MAITLEELLDIWATHWLKKKGLPDGIKRKIEYQSEKVDQLLKRRFKTHPLFNYHYHLNVTQTERLDVQLDHNTESRGEMTKKIVKVKSSGQSQLTSTMNFNGKVTDTWESTYRYTSEEEKAIRFMGSLSIGISAATLKAGIDYAVTRSRSQENAKTKTVIVEQGYDLKCPPGKKIDIDFEYVQQDVEMDYSVPVRLEGDVVVTCSQSFDAQSTERPGMHKTYNVSIKTIYDDLKIYVEDPTLDSSERGHIAEILESLKPDTSAHRAIFFILKGKITQSSLIDANAVYREEAIPGVSIVPEMPQALLQTERGEILAKGRTHSRFSLEISGRQAVGFKVVEEEAYSEERHKQFLASMQQVLPGDKLFFDSLVISGDGAIGFMLPNKDLAPTVHAFMQSVWNDVKEINQKSNEKISSVNTEALARAFNVSIPEIQQILSSHHQITATDGPAAALSRPTQAAALMGQQSGSLFASAAPLPATTVAGQLSGGDCKPSAAFSPE